MDKCNLLSFLTEYKDLCLLFIKFGLAAISKCLLHQITGHQGSIGEDKRTGPLKWRLKGSLEAAVLDGVLLG